MVLAVPEPDRAEGSHQLSREPQRRREAQGAAASQAAARERHGDPGGPARGAQREGSLRRLPRRWPRSPPAHHGGRSPGDLRHRLRPQCAGRHPAAARVHAPCLPGFSVEAFSRRSSKIRASSGPLRTATSSSRRAPPGRIRVLRTHDGATQPDSMETFAQGLDHPFGIAFYPPGPRPDHGVRRQHELHREVSLQSWRSKAAGPGNTLVPQLTHGGGGHWTRDIAFSPDGKRMFVSVGSASNDAESVVPLADGRSRSSKRRTPGARPGAMRSGAQMSSPFDPDGQNRHIFATGIRNWWGWR